MDHHSFLVEFLDSVWCNGNPAAAAAFFAPNAKIDGLGADESLTPQDLVTFAAAMLMLIDRPRWEVLHVVAQDNRASFLIRGYARSRKTGLQVTMQGQVMMRIENGLITEAYNNFDLISLFTDLGVVPSNLLETVLSGSMAA